MFRSIVLNEDDKNAQNNFAVIHVLFALEQSLELSNGKKTQKKWQEQRGYFAWRDSADDDGGGMGFKITVKINILDIKKCKYKRKLLNKRHFWKSKW